MIKQKLLKDLLKSLSGKTDILGKEITQESKVNFGVLGIMTPDQFANTIANTYTELKKLESKKVNNGRTKGMSKLPK